jgi:hypothetical protein
LRQFPFGIIANIPMEKKPYRLYGLQGMSVWEKKNNKTFWFVPVDILKWSKSQFWLCCRTLLARLLSFPNFQFVSTSDGKPSLIYIKFEADWWALRSTFWFPK